MSLGLSTYQVPLTSKGITEIEQLCALNEHEFNELCESINMLKGHCIKLRKGVELAKKGEIVPRKRSRSEENKTKTAGKTGKSGEKGGNAAGKSATGLAKDVERLMAKLAEIEQTRGDIGKAAELILNIDLERLKRALDVVEKVQETIQKLEEMQDTAEEVGSNEA